MILLIYVYLAILKLRNVFLLLLRSRKEMSLAEVAHEIGARAVTADPLKLEHVGSHFRKR